MLSEAMINLLKSIGATEINNSEHTVVISVPKKEKEKMDNKVLEIDAAVHIFYRLCEIKIRHSAVIPREDQVLIIFYPEPRGLEYTSHPEVLSESCD